MILGLLDDAVRAGAGIEKACDTIGLSLRTVERWREDPDADDERAGPKTKPHHALTAEERQWVLDVANCPQYRDLSPGQIVPLLADRNIYIASESSFYRVLHDHELMVHRSPARRPARYKPKQCVATAPCQVWSWDITYLRAPMRGTFYYLYLVLDIWSRKIVAWEVHEEESEELAAQLAEKAAAAEDVEPGTLILHSDNGGPMKGATMLATLQRLGIAASFSRPSVSDDNAACEAVFRTLKYRPGYPRRPFESIAAARAWVEAFVAWYNGVHLHSAIKYVTPHDRHEGRDVAILAAREVVYETAKRTTPRRWTGDTRDWTPVATVTLNPDRKTRAA